MTAALIIVAAANLAAGFLFGKIHERINWNVLIQKGIIPAPKKK